MMLICWNNLHKEVIMASDSDDAYTEASSESEEDLDPAAEDEGLPAETSAIEWQLASGRHGRLHLCCNHGLACGRELRKPTGGKGMAQALALNHLWSPRCWSAPPPAVQQWWNDSDKTE